MTITQTSPGTPPAPPPSPPVPVRPRLLDRARGYAAPPRIAGLDLARGLAIIGMIGAHIGVTADLEWSDPGTWSGIVNGRSSILFALIAGVSVALASGGRNQPVGEALRTARLRMVGRALVVLGIGVALEMLGTYIAIILPMYGILFLIITPFLGMRRRTLLIAAAGLALLGPTLLVALQMLTLGKR